jgi:hypothetical protein
VAVCPSCSRHLVDLGPRAALHEVVVADLEPEAEILRFPLEVDCPVIVGRGAAVKGIDLAMYSDGSRPVIDTVSRQHLMVRLTSAGSANWRLSVIDLNSTNGTTVQRWTGGGFDPAKPVPADQETHLGTRDRLILGETVLLRLSGKRYLAEPTSLPPEPYRLAMPPNATAVTRKQRRYALADRHAPGTGARGRDAVATCQGSAGQGAKVEGGKEAAFVREDFLISMRGAGAR